MIIALAEPLVQYVIAPGFNDPATWALTARLIRIPRSMGSAALALAYVANGRFATLLGWLRQNIHRHGRKFLPREILQRATGSALTLEPYLRYLQRKFGEIYGISTAGAPAAAE